MKKMLQLSLVVGFMLSIGSAYAQQGATPPSSAQQQVGQAGSASVPCQANATGTTKTDTAPAPGSNPGNSAETNSSAK